MYCDNMLRVGKVENGFLIEFNGRWKLEKDDKETGCCCSPSRGYGEKQLYAKDATDLGKKIEALVPLMTMEFEGEDAFEAAFSVASGIKAED